MFRNALYNSGLNLAEKP